MVPMIRSATDRIFCHFALFFALLFPTPLNNTENQNFEKMKKTPRDMRCIILHVYHENHDVWFLRYDAPQTEFFVILGHFLHFYPTTHKIKILKK